MKKLLILMLVLGLASTASAVPVIVGPSEIDIAVGYITLTLEGTEAEASQNMSPAGGGYMGVLWVDYAVYGGQLSNVSAPTNAMGGLADSGGSGPYMPSGLVFVGAPAAGDWNEDTDVDVGAWFTFQLDMLGGALVDDTYDVQILSDWGIGNLVYTHTVTVIPEPATMALLGLGSLFLMRRRRR